MPQTILSVAYPLVLVSPDTAGGAEQIISILDRQIVQAGHRSLVMAAQGSRLCGRLIPTPQWSGEIDESVRTWAAGEHRRILEYTLREFDVDIVHLHGLDFHEYIPEASVLC